MSQRAPQAPDLDGLYGQTPDDVGGWIEGLGLEQTVGGTGVPASTRQPVPFPATEEIIALAPFADTDVVDTAVAAASAAAPGWQAISWAQRRAGLYLFAGALEEDLQTLSTLLVAETGRPLRRCVSEVLSAARFIRTIADTAQMNTDIVQPGKSIRLTGRPLGVVGAIAPWNSPVLLAVVKVANALMAGNTMVLKSSPFTPLSGLRFGMLAREIFPTGVLNVINGGHEVGAAMVAHRGVAKISFTGSTATGKVIARAAADQLKRVTLELGGNDAAIVMADADLGRFVETASQVGLLNCGAFCAGVKRIYVHRSRIDEMLELFDNRLRPVQLGDPFDITTEMGPMQNRPQYERVLDLKAAARQAGGRVLGHQGSVPDRGLFIAPTVVSGLTSGHRLVVEEQFGPVLPIIAFDSVDDAVAQANASEYGLGGSVWGADVEAAEAVATRLDVGSAWVNQHGAFDAAIPMPFAGQSGIGIDYGGFGVYEHSQRTVVNVAR